MSEEAQGPQQSAPSSRSMRAVMQVNKLDYKMLDNISVVRSRRLTQSSFGKSTYSNGEIATVYLNNSSAYIDPSRSFLRFKINVPSANVSGGTVGLANGSALNIFKSVTLTTASGTEVYNERNFGQRKYIENRYSHDSQYIDNAGGCMGYGETDVKDGKYFAVPLSELGGIFNVRDKLIPSHLISGSKLEFSLNRPEEAFVLEASQTYSKSEYLLEDAVVWLDSVLLNDGVVRRLNDMASKNGLEMTFKTYDHAVQSTSSGASASLDQNRAVSNAVKAFVVRRRTSDLTLVTANSMEAITGDDIKSLFWKLGSANYPQQPINTKDTSGRSNYAHNLMVWNKLSHSPGHYTSVSFTDSKGKYNIVSVDLMRSALELDGQPINNGRILNAEVLYTQTDGATYDFYLEYVALAKIFLNRVVMAD